MSVGLCASLAFASVWMFPCSLCAQGCRAVSASYWHLAQVRSSSASICHRSRLCVHCASAQQQPGAELLLVARDDDVVEFCAAVSCVSGVNVHVDGSGSMCRHRHPALQCSHVQVREVRGRLQMRRQLARASACLEACKLLHQV